MKAINYNAPGTAADLYISDTPSPIPKSGEVLVRVKATALNRADLLQRQGKYPPPPGASQILGLEFAGVIETATDRWKAGERVMGIVSGGGYAELLVVPEGNLMKVPENLTFEEGAAIPEAFLTAYQTLVEIGGLKAGASVLIHAGASGVGTAAIQLAKLVSAKQIIVTAGSAAKLNSCAALGATHQINYKEESFGDVVKKITSSKGVDLILDFVGGPYWSSNIQSLAVDGTLLLIAMMGGPVVDKVNLAELFSKRAKVIATTLRSRSEQYKTDLTQKFSKWALPLFESSKLTPIIYKIFPWSEVSQAHQLMERNENIGKIVLKVS